jgi:hypothetical protein
LDLAGPHRQDIGGQRRQQRRAVVAAIAPICVDQFQRSADASGNLTALKKASTWEQATYVEKGGWAVMPGSKSVDDGVPQACAALLSNLK